MHRTLLGLAPSLLLAATVPALAERPSPQGSSVVAQAAAPGGGAKPAARRDRSSGFGELGSNREPIKIDADRLDVFDKDGRAVFAGNVVAVQGDATMRCSLLTVLYEAGRAAGAASGGASALAGGGDSAIRKLDCKGPVTIVSKTQVATGDHAEFDRARNRVLLTGNAALSDGPNVTRGERVSYDLNSGIASIEGGRVRALIVPGSGNRPATTGSAPAAGGPNGQKPPR